ncbi:MAG TPA: MarR family transcriptional regulator [Mycobacteriales bacterium]|nr:MarR family transcriptional regulator [Mycobacteriales bacterium]
MTTSADRDEAWVLLRNLVLDNERRRQVSDAVGMSFGRIKALRRIAAGSMTMGELAATLGTDPPYLTVVVDDLEVQGLVERRPHPTDRRAKLVVATRKGKDLARRAEAILGEVPPGMSALDDDELGDLLRILRKIAAD